MSFFQCVYYTLHSFYLSCGTSATTTPVSEEWTKNVRKHIYEYTYFAVIFPTTWIDKSIQLFVLPRFCFYYYVIFWPKLRVIMYRYVIIIIFE